MEEILHHLELEKPVNNGIVSISTGAGFLPLTVPLDDPEISGVATPKKSSVLRSSHQGNLEKSQKFAPKSNDVEVSNV